MFLLAISFVLPACDGNRLERRIIPGSGTTCQYKPTGLHSINVAAWDTR
jgi:hypothetical protein